LEAQLISRTITIDGNMSDWTNAPNITTNAGQFSLDCEVNQQDPPGSGNYCDLDRANIQSTGRDLRAFAFTWDTTYLYFYVERWASSTNQTNWLFYLDENNNGQMNSGERLFIVSWQGSNRTTEAELCQYLPANPAGDPLGGDGQTLPGTRGSCTTLYSGVVGGSVNGTEMESRLAWSSLGLSGPANVRFHISSARGSANNIPSQVEDNMTGPGGGGAGGGGGGQLFPPDMSVALEADTALVGAHEEVTFLVTLTNIYFDPFTNVELNLAIPSQLQYVSYVAPAGTTFEDSNTSGAPNLWQIPLLAPEEVLVLEVTVRGAIIPTTANTQVSASLVSWGGTDSNASNNEDAVGVQVKPYPFLSVTKISSSAQGLPGDLVNFTSTVTNLFEAEAHQVVVTLDVDPHLGLRLDTFGAGQPLQLSTPLGGSPSGLNLTLIEYSEDGGVTWDYTPISAGGGAPTGFDAQVTHLRLTLTGVMNANGSSFQLLYEATIL